MNEGPSETATQSAARVQNRAAEAVFPAKTRIHWTNYDTFNPASKEDLLEFTLGMSCSDFVHFAAFLAGQQTLSACGASGTVFTQISYKKWDGDLLPGGKLIIGIAPIWNNSNGYSEVRVGD